MADTLIQLRLPKREADDLRDAGKAAGRSLPGEIRHRLQAYQSAETGYGVERALGDLAASIGREAEIFDAMDPLPGGFLAVVKLAFGQVLDGMGAAPAANDAVEFMAKFIATSRLRALQSDQPLPPGLAEFAKIREALTPSTGKEPT